MLRCISREHLSEKHFARSLESRSPLDSTLEKPVSSSGGILSSLHDHASNLLSETSIEARELMKDLSFRYELRGYQKEILDLVRRKIEDGKREVHIVAPPGAGKTIIGLQILSHLKEPGLILSLNTTI